jgi:6-phosphogluconolactonase
MVDATTLDYGDRGKVVVLADGEALAVAAADTVIQVSAMAAERGRRALVALSGGSTPKRMGQILASERVSSRVRWDSLEIFWGDERWVPLESPESNAGEAMRGFLDASPIPAERVHPFVTTGDPATSASRMSDTLQDAMRENGVAAFDLVLLGMGDDGHTASLFPGTTAMHEEDRLVLSHWVPKLDTTRLTFTPPLINAAAKVVFLVGGAGKAAMLHRVLDGPVDIDLTPSQVVRPASGDLTWLIDAAAAAQLERSDSHG